MNEKEAWSLEKLFILFKKKKKLCHPKAVVDYLALMQSPGASPHTAPSSWSASGP